MTAGKDSGRKLNERQKAFIAAWTNPSLPSFGDATAAKRIAGYSDNYHNIEIINSMPNEVINSVNSYILSEALLAAKSIVDVRNDPSQLGAANKIKAADSILDRGGIVKKSQVEVVQEAPSSIFFLPAKAVLPTDE